MVVSSAKEGNGQELETALLDLPHQPSPTMNVASLYKRHCVYLPAMLGWFVCSASLSAYNKVIFGQDHGAFPCPLFLTSVHFLVQWIFSYLVSSACPGYFGGDGVSSMSWKTYMGVTIPCGFVTAVDVGLSNLSLVRISITFFTMVKSSSPIWVLASAFFFGIEKVSCNLITVGVLIMLGELLTAFGEVEFDAVGFVMVLVAAMLSGIRWTLVQFKLHKLDPPLKGSVATMRVLSSSMFVFMILLSCTIEQPWAKLGPSKGDFFSTFDNGMKTISLGLTGACIAIAMILCEFWLILKSNAIVLMIGGVLKEMITILVGVTVFGDELNLINVSGICVVFSGVFLYKATLIISQREREIQSSGQIESDANFARIRTDDMYDNEGESPKRHSKRMRGHKNSDPDLALNLKIDDVDDDEEVVRIDAKSPLNKRGNSLSLELDKSQGDEEKEAIRIV
mmetsp:Transcript_27266/g.57369  ORF Transcript_27266/g.57369 Transcript_27266/m.57369 type:complete len:452 (-) Transcript_27266:90-1445(-)